jgi:hypothetical protein
MYWFERELLVYPDVDLDLDELARHSSKIIVARGSEIRPRSLYHPNVEALARRVNVGILDLPGAHVGYLFYPERFAEELVKVLLENAEKES